MELGVKASYGVGNALEIHAFYRYLLEIQISVGNKPPTNQHKIQPFPTHQTSVYHSIIHVVGLLDVKYKKTTKIILKNIFRVQFADESFG